MNRIQLPCLLLLICLGPLRAGSIGINFGDATTTSENWNNVPSTSGEIESLIYLDGSDSGIFFDISDEFLFNGVNTAGVTEPGEPAIDYFPGDVTNTSVYGNTAVWGGTINDFVQFTLSNLTPGTSYQSTFYAVRTGASDNRETEYDVAGSTRETVYLDAAANGAGDGGMIAQTNFIEADSNGEITYSLQPGANNTNGNGFFYLSALHIEEGTGGTKPGDFNMDSDVNQEDFDILLSNFHRTDATFANGDINLDGTISLHDYAQLRLILEADGTPGLQSVPEPAGPGYALIAIFSLVSALRWRRTQ